MALYARVSTQEQTRGNYPSCESQIEELEHFCNSQGWMVLEAIKDEGISAGSLKRKGLTHMRWLMETGQIDGILCTWYDRLVRTRDFYILDREFNQYEVEFITLHDPTDRKTASGRFLETMLVAAKTYEREQTAEKVRTKLRMRTEKGLWNGGLVPFGFMREPDTQLLLPQAENARTVQKMFEVYVNTQSDFAVRNWLKAHNIPAPGGKAEWTPSSIRDLLMNRRYIGEIEINKDKNGIEDLPEFEAYRVVPTPHEPIISRELFELAAAIRSNRSAQNTTRGGKGKGNSVKGKGKSFSRNQCHRVYLLQGNMVCGICGAMMSPHYVYHKPNPKEQRRTASYIFHYTCAEKMKYRQAINHSNRVLARVAENWVLDNLQDLATSEAIVKQALEIGLEKVAADLEPARTAMAQCRKALHDNQERIDTLIETAINAQGSLLELLTEKANKLKMERELLKVEERRLTEVLAPLNASFSVAEFQEVLTDFSALCDNLEPLDLQRLLRVMVRRIEWMPDGNHRVHYYLPTSDKRRQGGGRNGQGGAPHWFETTTSQPATPHSNVEPVRAFGCGLFCIGSQPFLAAVIPITPVNPVILTVPTLPLLCQVIKLNRGFALRVPGHAPHQQLQQALSLKRLSRLLQAGKVR